MSIAHEKEIYIESVFVKPGSFLIPENLTCNTTQNVCMCLPGLFRNDITGQCISNETCLSKFHSYLLFSTLP